MLLMTETLGRRSNEQVPGLDLERRWRRSIQSCYCEEIVAYGGRSCTKFPGTCEAKV